MTEEKPKRGALLYYQLASVILLLVLVGFSISGLWGLVKIGVPKLTEEYEWKRVSTFDRYIEEKYQEKNGVYYSKYAKEDTTQALTREKVEAKWKSAQENVLDDERREGLRMIMLWFVVVLVCLPLYLYHHKAVKKGRQAMEQAGV
ncbi:MAG TPA: hypothetical protein VI546_01460 [candidate division Zixibacteria bacterium]|nr:hypothetical protein [candidate division Zixibacteria bacterium]